MLLFFLLFFGSGAQVKRSCEKSNLVAGGSGRNPGSYYYVVLIVYQKTRNLFISSFFPSHLLTNKFDVQGARKTAERVKDAEMFWTLVLVLVAAPTASKRERMSVGRMGSTRID